MAFIRRVAAICLRPASEWRVIAGEVTPPSRVFVGYVLPLAVFAAIVSTLGIWAGRLDWSNAGQLAWPMIRTGIIFVVLVALMTCAVAGILIDGFATTFHGTPDRMQAFKLAGYAYTPLLLVTLTRAVPYPLGLLFVFAAMAYSVYLLVIGIPILMRAPADRALPYALLAAVGAGLAGQWITVALSPLLRL